MKYTKPFFPSKPRFRLSFLSLLCLLLTVSHAAFSGDVPLSVQDSLVEIRAGDNRILACVAEMDGKSYIVVPQMSLADVGRPDIVTFRGVTVKPEDCEVNAEGLARITFTSSTKIPALPYTPTNKAKTMLAMDPRTGVTRQAADEMKTTKTPLLKVTDEGACGGFYLPAWPISAGKGKKGSAANKADKWYPVVLGKLGREVQQINEDTDFMYEFKDISGKWEKEPFGVVLPSKPVSKRMKGWVYTQNDFVRKMIFTEGAKPGKGGSQETENAIGIGSRLAGICYGRSRYLLSGIRWCSPYLHEKAALLGNTLDGMAKASRKAAREFEKNHSTSRAKNGAKYKQL